MSFDRKNLNENIVTDKLLQIIQQAESKLAAAGFEKNDPKFVMAVKETAKKVAKMGLSGPMNEQTLDQFLLMSLIMELKPEMGNSLGLSAFNLEMKRIETLLASKLAKLDPNDPKSLESLKLEIAALLKANPANANIPKPDLDSIAAKMAQKLFEKYAKPRPEPSNKKENEEENEYEKRNEKRDEDENENKDKNKLTLLERTNLALMGFLLGKESREFNADLTQNMAGNPMGAVSQNPEKDTRSFLDMLENVISFKNAQDKEELDNSHRHNHTPLSMKPKPPGIPG